MIVGPVTIQLQLLLLDTMPCELPPTGHYREKIRDVSFQERYPRIAQILRKLRKEMKLKLENIMAVLYHYTNLTVGMLMTIQNAQTTVTTMHSTESQIPMCSLDRKVAKSILSSLKTQYEMLQNVMDGLFFSIHLIQLLLPLTEMNIWWRSLLLQVSIKYSCMEM